ncbi:MULTISPECIES: helix-turn-helix transcriptional regulator [Caballeronia]|uniref:Bacterial regulatory protein, arsR family n=2 Tax=Caballeronia cordobensis TaxID=1353886 RepID=A0A158HL27_CABCO|nr:winged helix-turn-helix transcriptional regulator [Caballeronia sp. CLC5]AET92775.1 putative transcriptional regulator [Burkholderia sp. YI23]AQH02518.1 transcriptional regulator [Burkholderia sp. KK1]SAL44956.1 Bacterial regulatory protein, arsR family [Caballeronia cordobensis]BAO90118.1 putative transcriptional regulator [Burkholderia sp. RPE67]BBQ00092.1 TrmB family transcriptional regulator [Burkholderia sp. SFA1]
MATDPMSSTRQGILDFLLERKSGSTVDEIIEAIGLSRTAVNQHLIALERRNLIEKGTPRKTGGRPVQVYVLTQEGTNQFPKQYSWFSALLVSTLRDELGPERLDRYMFDLGVKTSASMIPRLVGKTRSERVTETVKIMNEAGFRAMEIGPDRVSTLSRVECTNCVYHDLTKTYPEVCRFDIGFLTGLMGTEVEHQACMQRGGDACRFRFKPFP